MFNRGRPRAPENGTTSALRNTGESLPFATDGDDQADFELVTHNAP